MIGKIRASEERDTRKINFVSRAGRVSGLKVKQYEWGKLAGFS
jgi:hypothetical protein